MTLLAVAMKEMSNWNGEKLAKEFDVQTQEELEEILDVYSEISNLIPKVEKIAGYDISTLSMLGKDNIYREMETYYTLCDVVRRYAEELGKDPDSTELSDFTQETQKKLRYAAESYVENREVDANMTYWQNIDHIINGYL